VLDRRELLFEIGPAPVGTYARQKTTFATDFHPSNASGVDDPSGDRQSRPIEHLT
jgi:hypothetical protein